MRHLILGGLVLGLLLAVASPARAEKKKTREIVVPPIEIVLRNRPIVSIDVQRVPPRLMLAEVAQPMADKVERAAYSEPF